MYTAKARQVKKKRKYHERMKSFRLSILYELSLAASLIKVKIIIRATLKKRANRLAKDDK